MLQILAQFRYLIRQVAGSKRRIDRRIQVVLEHIEYQVAAEEVPAQLFQERQGVAEVVFNAIVGRVVDRVSTGILARHGPPKGQWESAQDKADNS